MGVVVPGLIRNAQSPMAKTSGSRVVCSVGVTTGSVRTRASKYSLCFRTCGDVPSRGFQDGQHGRGPPEVEQSLAVGGNVLVMAGAEVEKVAEFVVGPAEPSG